MFTLKGAVSKALLSLIVGGSLLAAASASRAEVGHFTTLYAFSPMSSTNADGTDPSALVLGPDGNFYGTTAQGGGSVARNGTLFRVTPAGAFTTIHTFALSGTPVNADGELPNGPLAVGTDGCLYGTTLSGGANGSGTVFKATLDGTVTTLYTFSAAVNNVNTDGLRPGPLVLGPDGNFYGAASGGANGTGVLYQITPAGAYTLLHTFAAPTGSYSGHPINADGAWPGPRLFAASDGNLYGTAYSGGSTASGTIYRITPGGAFTLLHTLTKGTTNSQGPNTEGTAPSGITEGSDGNFYVTTHYGGKYKNGVVAKMTPAGAVTVLHHFTGLNSSGANIDGMDAFAPVIQASDGNFYGIAEHGGAEGMGTVFRITPTGVFSTLYTCPGPFTARFAEEGANPLRSLVQGADGNLYGTTEWGGSGGNGTIFRLNLPMITSFSPANAKALSPPFTLTINGTGFQNGAVVKWASTNLSTTFVSANQLTAQVTSSQLTKPGVYKITVTNPDGSSNTASYTVTNPEPVLTSISPTSANAGSPDTTITVKGKGYLPSSVVRWNGTDLATTYVTAGTLTAVIPAGYMTSPTSASVTVFNPAPGGGSSAPKTFTVVYTTVSVTNVTLERDSGTGVITAHLTIGNTGYQTAANTKITSGKLNTTATTTPLPVSLGDITAGSSTTADLKFAGSAGAAGTQKKLVVSGTFTGGTWTTTITVTLP